MTTFADPSRCPSCDLPATGSDRCARCGLHLTGSDAVRLLSVLADADTILARMRTEAATFRSRQLVLAGGGAPPARPAATPSPVAAADLPQFPGSEPRPPQVPVRRWSTGTLILGLGVLCLVVAAFVFITVSWGHLGLPAKTAILVAITAGFGAGAVAVTRRRLSASAEALWTVTGCLAALDYAAARSYGLAGLDRLHLDVSAVLFGSVLLVVAALITLWAAAPLGRQLWSGQVGCVLGAGAAVLGLASMVALPSFWAVLLAAVAAAGLGLALWSVGLRLVGWTVGAISALLYAAASGVAVVDHLVGATAHSLVVDGQAVPSVVLAVLAVAVGLGFGPRVRSSTVPVAICSFVATGQLVAIPYAVLLGYDGVGSTLGVAVLATALMAVAVVVRGPWGTGFRVVALASSLPLIGVCIVWLATAAGTVLSGLSPVWTAAIGVRPPAVTGAPGPAWLASLSLVALAVTVTAFAYWRDLPTELRRRPELLAGSAAILALAAVVQLGLQRTPMVVLAAVVVLVAGAVTTYGLLAGSRAAATWRWTGLTLLAAACVLPLRTEAGSLVIWSAVLVCVVVAALLVRSPAEQVVTTAMATTSTFVVVLTAADLLGGSDRDLHLALVVTTCVVGLGAQLLAGAPLRRLPAECVAGVALVASVAAGLEQTVAWQVLMLTVLGACTALVALVRADRRFLAPVAVALLGSAYILRLAAADIRLVEAYTLPFAVVLLAAGLLVMHHEPRIRTRVALLPGLALALLPSLPQAMEDPVSLRGLLLGTGALAILVVGVVQRWQAPFLAGAVVLAVVVARQLGPYADGVPRWVLIAAAGVALLAAGITWEARVRNARSAAGYVGAMR